MPTNRIFQNKIALIDQYISDQQCRKKREKNGEKNKKEIIKVLFSAA